MPKPLAEADQEPAKPARHPLVLWLLANARWIWPLVVIAVIFMVTWSDLRTIHYRQVQHALHRIELSWLTWVWGLTIANLAVMGLYDVICLRGAQVRARERWWIGTLAFAWSNFLTLGPLAGPAIRFWLYRPFGVSFHTLRQAIVSIAVGFGGGLLFWIPFVLMPLPQTGWVSLAIRAVLVFLTAFLAGLLAGRLQLWKRFPVWIRDLDVRWPGLFMLGALDWTLAFLVFEASLHAAGIDLAAENLGRLYFLGQGLGVLSLIPGGLGSADVFWLAGLGPVVEKAAAGLLVYRLIYYVIPWSAATLLLLRRAVHGKVRWAGPARWFVSLIVLFSGGVMLISSATPDLGHRIRTLEQIVPIAILETSHVASAIFGLFLFVLARGLMKGYRFSYRTALALLLGGAVGSLLKALDYEEAIIFVLTAALLWTHAELFTLPSRKGGTAIAILTPITLAIFVFAAAGFAAYNGSQLAGASAFSFPSYFSHTFEAARFLRTLSILFLFGLLIAFYLIMRIPHRYVPPTSEVIDRALTLHQRLGKGTTALMAANADKSILFLHDTGFCLYRTVGRYMVVLADPTLEPGAERKCLGVMLQKAAELDRTLVFYQISAHWLPVLHDFGYSFFKLGEEAFVDLDQFNIQGNKGKAMRNVLNRFRNDGYTFEVLPAAKVPDYIPELKNISDAWLRSKKARERQFSIGSFDPSYLSRFPCAIVRDVAGKAVAFANVLMGPNQEEFSIDLMRYMPVCPNGVIDLLFLQLFEWGKGQGFRTFNLGMAPLATVGEVRQARLGERLANILFQHGEHWYNFRGIRLFKQKFDPRWVPRYLAYPAFWMWPQVIVNVAALIAGGWKNLIFPTERHADAENACPHPARSY
ncbi:MAG: bifunctional lysylphosphatidylglycerol flippase/synthetase MprF [Acidobacteriia bacterium]|nr:bifunctional lysylphosphatidylglycerol flippase/synthetase MprF [Terriglobia bacterium]